MSRKMNRSVKTTMERFVGVAHFHIIEYARRGVACHADERERVAQIFTASGYT